MIQPFSKLQCDLMMYSLNNMHKRLAISFNKTWGNSFFESLVEEASSSESNFLDRDTAGPLCPWLHMTNIFSHLTVMLGSI